MPLIDTWTETHCDNCDSDGDIYEYDSKELCESCLIELLMQRKIVTIAQRHECADCGESSTLRYGGDAWCIDCLMAELEHDGVIKEV